MLMMGPCGGLMAVAAGIAILLGLGFLASLIILTWTVVGWLWRDRRHAGTVHAAWSID
jgi:hypothetical protein